MQPLLEVRNLSKTFTDRAGAVHALRCVTIAVHERELVSIVGPSGCGKTTLLECIAGLEHPDEGEVCVYGQPPAVQANARVGYMTQNDVMLPWRTVAQNISLPLEIQGVSRAVIQGKTQKLMHEFGLAEFTSSSPSALSGGMRQRASLARTYLTGSSILLLDEPFGRLDALTRSEMQAWFLRIWEHEKKTVLMVTHDVDEALLLSDRIYVLTPRPGTNAEEIAITLPRPRMLTTTILPEFGIIKEKILRALKVIS